MKRVSKFTYKVKTDEVVTMVFNPIGVAEEFVAVAVDGDALVADPPSPPTYKFRVKKSAGDVHFCIVECSFMDDTSSTARFESTIQGSFGGDFAGPTIMKGDPILDPNIKFEVV